MGRIWNNQLNQSGNFLNQNQLNVGIDVDSSYNDHQLYHHYAQQQHQHQHQHQQQQKHQQQQYQYQLDQQEYHHENFNYNNIKRFDHSNDFRRYNPLQPPPPPSMINFSSHTTNNPLNKNLDELSDDDIESSNNFDDSKDRPAIFPIIPMEMKADAYRVLKNDEICDPDPLNPLKNDHENIQNNNIISIDEILMQPGRISRPSKLVVILRGPPGSGKTHVAKLIKKFEVEMGGSPPRILSIDDYFMTEIEREEKCPKTGRKIVKKEMEYEYEKAMEPTYMQYLIKSYKKTLTDGLFDFIIVDSVNSNIKTINEYHDLAKTNRFMPYIIELDCNLETCLNQNVHKRSEEDIQNIIRNWDSTPSSYIKLDIKSLLQREAIQEVEMDDISETDEKFPNDEESDDAEVPETSGQFGFLKSKWDTDSTDLKLARLDGISKPMNKSATLEDYLQMDGWEPPPSSSSSKKRVRWADIEEKREQDKMRAIGFVVGQTDWNRMMDTTDGSSALTKTKYIEKIKRN